MVLTFISLDTVVQKLRRYIGKRKRLLKYMCNIRLFTCPFAPLTSPLIMQGDWLIHIIFMSWLSSTCRKVGDIHRCVIGYEYCAGEFHNHRVAFSQLVLVILSLLNIPLLQANPPSPPYGALKQGMKLWGGYGASKDDEFSGGHGQGMGLQRSCI